MSQSKVDIKVVSWYKYNLSDKRVHSLEPSSESNISLYSSNQLIKTLKDDFRVNNSNKTFVWYLYRLNKKLSNLPSA